MKRILSFLFCVTLGLSVFGQNTPSVNAAVKVCEGATIPNLTATGTNIKWYSDAGLTNLVGTGNSFATGKTKVGTYVYYATQTVNAQQSAGVADTLIIQAVPNAPVSGGDQAAYVGGAIPSLSATAKNSATLNWYSDLALNQLVGTGQTLNTGKTTAGTYTFYVNATKNGCSSTATVIQLTLTTAASAWTVLTPVQANVLYGVTALNSSKAIAVGASGALEQYNGTAWSIATSGLSSNINAVHFYNERNVWAVGNSGKALKYNGTTWTQNNNSSTSALYCVAVADSTNIWAAGANGKLIKNNGSTWSTQSSGIYVDIKGISFASPTKGVLVGTYGTISVYNGTSWAEQTAVFSNDFYGVYMLDATTAWAVGSSGTIVKYNGSTWTQVTSGTTATLRSVYFTSATDGWAAGDGGVLLHYNGTSWSTVVSGTTNALNSISFSDANHGFAVGATGTILKYANQVSAVTPPAILPQVICKGETTPAFTTNGTAIKWYSDANLSTQVGTGNSYTPTVSNVGTYTYYATDTQNNNTSVATKVTLTIRDTPSAPTSDGNESITQGSALAPLSVSGNEINWYSDINLTTKVAAGNTFSPINPATGTTTYYATQTVNECSSVATAVTLTITPVVKSSAKDITAFGFVNPAMTGTISGTDIAVTVPFGTTLTNLVATFTVSDSAKISVLTVNQKSGVTQNDFTNPIQYLVTAEDGSTKTYTVTVTVSSNTPSTAKEILSFGFTSPAVTATINGTNITATVPNATDLKNLKANFTISPLATVTVNTVAQTSGTSVVDFSSPVTYIVKAEDNSTKSFTITITLQAPNAPIAASPATVCEGGTIPNLTATGSTIKWYADSTLQNLVFAGASLSTGKTSAGTYTYYATQTSNAKESAATKVILTIQATPSAPVSAGDQTAYEGGYIPTLNVNAVNGTTITWFSDLALTQQVGTGTSLNTSKTALGNYTFYATASISECKSTATTVKLTIANGASWSVVTPIQSNILFGVSANSATSAFAVGATGVLDNYAGSNWTVGTSGLTTDINAVHYLSPTSAWAVGKSGKTLKYNGTSWTSITNSSTLALYAVYAVDATTIYAGGATGKLMKSTNGTTWSNITTANVYDVRSISFASASKGVFVGTSGSIYVYNGTSWNEQTSATFNNDFYGVQMLDANTAWAVGSAGTIVKYNGTTWSPVTSGTTATLRSVNFTSATNGWAVGDGGVILHYDGTSWSTVASGTTNNLNSVSFSDANNGWAVGAAGTILQYKNLASNITPPSVTPTTACQGTTIPAFTTMGTNIKWYSDAQLKTKVGTGNSYTPTVSSPGTYTYYVTDSINGSKSIASSVTLTIYSTPSAPVSGGNATMYEGATVNPLTATGSNVAWYSDAQTTAQIGTGTSYTPNAPSNGLNTYYATQTVNGCMSPATTITLTVIPKSTAKDLTAFSFNGLNPSVTAVINGTTITATVPFGTDVSNLVATFSASNLATVQVGTTTQLSGITLNDFKYPVTYIVTAENGSTKNYTVTVNIAAPSTVKDITAFSFASLNISGVINGTNITATVPFGTDVSNLVATFNNSALSSVNILGTPQVSATTTNDFTNPVLYTVVAQDGSTKDYTVTVTIAAPSTAKDITAFSFAALSMNGTINDTTITFTVPYGTNVSNLVATFTASNLASVKVGTTTQVSATTPNNFTDTVKYVVTAQDGSTKNYRVIVTITPASTAKNITAFSVNIPNIVCAINGTNITATVPFGTNVSNVIATFTNSPLSTVSVNNTTQVSGTTSNDFTNPVTYVVTAQDNSTQNYTVTITVTPPSSAKNLTAFSILSPSATGTFNGNTITVNVPYGTNVKQLVATFTASNLASVSVGQVPQSNGVTQNDFTNPVSYMVTAQDNSTQIYTVIVVVTPRVKSSAKDITAFSISNPNMSCTINGTSITATVPYATNVTNLVATFLVSDSAKVSVNTITQVSGTTTNDFSNAVVYTVTAEDGSVKNYIVTISIAAKVLSSAKDITSFSIKTPATNCTINGTDIKATLPYGTDLTKLVAIFNASALSTVTVNSVVQVNGTTENDFSQLVTYTVTAEDGSYQNYDVTLTVVSKSSAKDITDFSFVSPSVTATIDQTNITATVPYGTDITKLTANFTASNLAVVSVNGTTQTSGTSVNDFTNPVQYTVTAENGTVQTYTVTVTIAPSPKSNENNILSFVFVSPVAYATINGTSITATLPYGSDLTKLLVNFQASANATVTVNGTTQVSGTTTNNFSTPVIYTVTAENGAVKTYTVTVSLAKNSAKEITAFLFTNPVATGTVNGNTISLQVPYGTDVTKLVANFTSSAGATVKVGNVTQTSGVNVNDFTSPVTYTVYAEDGTSSVYTVVVYVLPAPKSNAKELLTFGITTPYITGIITGTNVAIKVPFGTNVKSLTAFFTISPKAIAYIGNVGQITGASINDFSQPVTYTITAEDGSTKTYVVTVTVDKNPLGITDITASNVAVYPNPSYGDLFVQAEAGPLSISIIDLQGREVYHYENTSFIGEEIKLNLGELTSSTFIMTISSNGIQTMRKIEILK
jgi:photosystem II stability/assembly factor-like uncharacterized protein